MYQAAATDLRTAISQTISSANEAISIFETPATDGSQFELSLPVAGTEVNAAEIITAFRLIVDQINPELDDLEALMVPNTTIKPLTALFQQIKTEFDNVRNNLTASGPIQSIANPANYEVANPSGNASATKQLRNVFVQLEQAFAHWSTLRMLLKAPKQTEFAVTVRSLSTKISEIQSELAEIRKQRSKIKTLQESFETQQVRMTAAASEAERLLGETQEGRRTVSEAAVDGAERLARIEGILTTAGELKGVVEQHREQFEAFDRVLSDRRADLEARSTEATSLLNQLATTKVEIERIAKAANEMLKGATNAGLASTFSSRVDELKSQVTGARWAFYGSIIFLMGCAIPLAIYLLPREFAAWLAGLVGGSGALTSSSATPLNGSAPSGTAFLGQVLARAALLVPALWLTRFTSARHDKLFRLMEHYRHKYSIAMSVEGFKQQAPDYRDEIAATTFFELSFNPADSMDRKTLPPRIPKRIMDALMKRLEKAVDDTVKPPAAT